MCVAPALPAQGETVLEEINRTGIFKVGIRTSRIPFAYTNNRGELEGVCFDLVRLIEQELIKNIDRHFLSIQLFISSIDNRFEIVEDGVVHLECGPNSIREIKDYQITFSQPFFTSGIRFLTQEKIARKLVNSQGQGFRIGILRNSSAEKLITEKYPLAEFEYFQGQKALLRAFQAVKGGQIDALANDSILLIGESVQERFPLGETTGYVLTPEKSLSCEKYGFILPVNNPEWENLVNGVINSQETSQVFENWFNVFSTESFRNLSGC
jgi:polar amino acid transport system substrate-binding protein